MRKAYVIPALAVCVGLAASSAYRFVSAADADELSRLGGDVQLEADSDLMLGIVPTRTTVAGLFKDHAIATPEATALVSSIGDAFDLRRVRAGQPYTIDRLFDGRIRRFEYEIDADRRLLATRASIDGAPRFITSVEIIPKQTEVVSVEGEINRQTNSLTAAIDKAGEGIQLALSLADVFSGEIDFSSDLQPGDHFRLVVERRTREGKPAGYGAILAAEFENDGRTVQAIRFTPDGGTPGYYDAQGRSLKRFFLKSPLKFEPRGHVTVLDVADASDPRLRARAQRRGLPRAHGRADRLGRAGRGHVRRLDDPAAAARSACGIRTATRASTSTCRRSPSAWASAWARANWWAKSARPASRPRRTCTTASRRTASTSIRSSSTATCRRATPSPPRS